MLAGHELPRLDEPKRHYYDNAVMEAFSSSLNNEPVHRSRFATGAEDRPGIFGYIESFYNRTCKHSTLGEKSPTSYRTSIN